MKISKITLRNLFTKKSTPNQEAFWNLFDSYWHKDDPIDIAAVNGLENQLANKLGLDAQNTITQAFENALENAILAKWSAIDVYEEYAGKIIKKLDHYIGGEGTPPTANIGEYYKAAGGFTTDKDQAANFKENVTMISPDQTTFAVKKMTVGKNIANPANRQNGKYVNWETGAIDINAFYDAFVKLQVESDTDYFFPNLYHIIWEDETHVFISGENNGGYSSTKKSPLNAKFVSVSFLAGETSIQIEKGTSGSPFEAYAEIETIQIPKILVKPSQTTFTKEMLVYGKNRFDKTKVTTGKYVNAFTGNLDDNPSYEASDYCDINGLDEITLTNLIHIAFYNENKNFISGREYGGDTIDVPIGAFWSRISLINDGMKETFQLEEGAMKTSYKSYTEPRIGLSIPNLITPGAKSLPKKISNVLPSRFYIATGVEADLYFDNMAFPGYADLSKFYGSVFGYRGKFLEKQWRYTAVDEDPFVVYFKAENQDGVLMQQDVVMNIGKSTNGAGETVNYLELGDSTTNAGVGLYEMKNFFDNDVMDVTFLGTRETLGVKHEGRGGWKFLDYATAGRQFFKFNYVTANVSKDDVYSVNGSEYTVREVNTGYFSAEKTSGTNNPNSTGTLIKVAGSGTTSINYTSFELISGNPFWNSTTQSFDFTKYLNDTSQSMGAGDFFVINLGINDLFGIAVQNGGANAEQLISSMISSLEIIISGVKAHDLNINIGICTTIPPAISQDATGLLLNSSTYSLERYVKNGLVNWWQRLIQLYDNNESRQNKIYLLPTHVCIDRVNNFPTHQANIDDDNTRQRDWQDNDVHPNESGYKQLAEQRIGFIKFYS